jgi:hypothetical protein
LSLKEVKMVRPVPLRYLIALKVNALTLVVVGLMHS